MNRILSVGAKFPAFEKTAVVSTEVQNEFAKITSEDHVKKGQWMVMFWWPMDFTFVCPTEIAAFGDKSKDFADRNVQLIGASTDTEFVHLAWRNNHPALKNLSFPMLADTSKSLAEELGILESNSKVAYRVSYIVDPNGIIRHVSVNDLSVGRNVDEILRVVDALQTDKLTPCNWKKGEKTLN
ncbi:MAG: peroxiredoxin [Prevotellaceae bacterium]|jgi:peroxiredoxin (alkyl hydroperoxide reductase subunit C)|nr:peroxiredoxin [Prevotellaceae bacterium]